MTQAQKTNTENKWGHHRADWVNYPHLPYPGGLYKSGNQWAHKVLPNSEEQ